MRGYVPVVALLAAMACPRAAAAQPAVSPEARAAYDRGTSAYNAGEYATAAREYALADELAPNAVALESALKAAVRAEEAGLVMTLVDRSARAPMPPSLTSVVQSARGRFAGRAGQVTIVCPAAWRCSAMLDGAAFPVGEPRWVGVGGHVVELTIDGQTERRGVTVVAEAPIELHPAPRGQAPAATGAPAGRSESPSSPVVAPAVAPVPVEAFGASPAWFWALAGVTAVAGGITIGSGLAAQHDYATWDADHRDTAAKASAQDGAVRTNILLVATGVGALASATVGIFAVRWSGATSRASGSRYVGRPCPPPLPGLRPAPCAPAPRLTAAGLRF